MSKLNHFLKLQRQSFLSSASNNSNGLPAIVMGNEAGDLDSLACSIAFSYLSSISSSSSSPKGDQIYPLIQTYRRDLHLRPENQLALKNCLIDPDNLICLEDLEKIQFKVGKLSLVDHNRLTSRFKDFKKQDVEAVIDHHQDENLYQSASIREIVPPTTAGSCSSILSLHFKSQFLESKIDIPSMFPSELATLLLSAILIDTHCLDPKVGKAKPKDQGAVEFLYPLSSIRNQNQEIKTRESQDFSTLEDLNAFHKELEDAKNDVSQFNTVDLIRRDYKEYIHPSLTSSTWKVGLTSVPIGLSNWVSKESQSNFISGCSEFLTSSNLDLLGILTAFKDEKDGNKFKREILFYSSGKIRDQMSEFYRVLEGNGELELKEIKVDGLDSGKNENQKDSQGDFEIKVYDQRVLKATRKQVAPAVKDACSKVKGPTST